MVKFLVKYSALIGISSSLLIFTGFIINSLTIYDETTELGTVIFFSYTNELSPNFYSLIQLLSTLPLASVLLITVSILGLYVKINRSQVKSQKSLDKFMILSAKKAQIDLLYTQEKAKNDYFFGKDTKLYFATETNLLIEEFNVFGLEKLDTTDLTVDEQLEIKNETLTLYLGLKEFFEKVKDTIKLAQTVAMISELTAEIDELMIKKV